MIQKLIEGQREEDILNAEMAIFWNRISNALPKSIERSALGDEKIHNAFKSVYPEMKKIILIKFLDSEIERLEKDKARVNGLTLRGELEHGYILFVEDQIKHLQDIKKQLTQNNG